MEEDEEYEMLEVQEEEEHAAAPLQPTSAGSVSDGESPNKSFKSNSSTGSPDKDEKSLLKSLVTPKSSHAVVVSAAATPIVEEKKILNALSTASGSKFVSVTTTPQTPTAAAAAALQKKGITMKKTTPTTPLSGSGVKASLASVAQKTTPGKRYST